jgi:hypothetical protein
MKLRLSAALFLLVLLLFSRSAAIYAQPSLPNLAGAGEHGVVLLSWVCQYDGVKSIAVRRSDDSMLNYKVVGYVKDTKKGVQAFADGHPVAGKNFYKLNVVFNSGLNWGSNHLCVFVDSAELVAQNRVLPDNDSLQQFMTTEIVLDTIVHSDSELHSVKLTKDSTKLNVMPGVVVQVDTQVQGVAKPVVVRKKIVLKFTQPEIEEATFIKSMYLSINRLNGHLEVRLPDGMKGHIYSLKFYDMRGLEVLDIPELKERFVIVDKRNFRRNGLLKFELRRDGEIFETAYIELKP